MGVTKSILCNNNETQNDQKHTHFASHRRCRLPVRPWRSPEEGSERQRGQGPNPLSFWCWYLWLRHIGDPRTVNPRTVNPFPILSVCSLWWWFFPFYLGIILEMRMKEFLC